jgi:hypothetical protein
MDDVITPAKNWMDELVNDPLIYEFERLGMPGIVFPKTQLEISQMIRLQKERRYSEGTYDENKKAKWSMLRYHFEQFKIMEQKNPVAF